MPDETTPMTSPGSPRDHSSRHGRFVPGAMFGKRFRILGLLGRGGMGEVYRADDLELGQTVALKLLPSEVTGDSAALDLLRNEVRVARQVSHPNVCRVYDIGEVSGQYFLSMEYVDGEDLASLLRRIGRLSREKGLDIIGQLAAGLAAAHQLGVLHRDLKPANIMVDGHGMVRVMDFGLAGFTDELRASKELAGTLSYMAPEQLAGRGSTARSDVYSFGLVMYEILTGRRAYEAAGADQLRKAQMENPPPAPSNIATDLDPTVERVVMWCLEADPARRPTSAQVVAKALPGGDPLANALAAGETPSPEMVAAAGGRGGMRPLTAALCLAGIIIGMLVIAGLNNGAALFRLARLDKPPVVLADRARRILNDAGLEEEPGATVYKLGVDRAFLRQIQRNDSTPARWQQLREAPYAVYYLWYRESPSPLIPYDTRDAKVTYFDPPMHTPGMAYVRLSTDGRLLDLEVVAEPESVWEGDPEAVDWSKLFTEAGLKPTHLEQVGNAGLKVTDENRQGHGPGLTPRVPTDHMAAWVGPSPWRSQDSLKVRAGSYQARPVFFSTNVTYKSASDSRAAGVALGDTTGAEHIGETGEPASGFGAGVAIGMVDTEATETGRSVSYDAGMIVGVVIGFASLALVLVVLVGGPFMAWRNLRMGRGDRCGALRFGLFAFGLVLVNNLLVADHAILIQNNTVNLGYEYSILLGKLGMAILYGAYVALAYLALEPYVRRHWPNALISWTRLLRGKLGDPLVGRDLLLGSVCGVLIALLWLMRHVAPPWFGLAPPCPFSAELAALKGGAGAIATFVSPTFLFPSMLGVLALVVLVILLRRRWLALTVLVVLVIAIGALGEFQSSGDPAGTSLTTVVCLSAMVAVLLLLFVRSGLLALTAAFFFFRKIRRFPLTLDSSAWYAGTSTLVILALAAIAVYALSAAIRGYSKASGPGLGSNVPNMPPE